MIRENRHLHVEMMSLILHSCGPINAPYYLQVLIRYDNQWQKELVHRNRNRFWCMYTHWTLPSSNNG